jgi:hypothetical protein
MHDETDVRHANNTSECHSWALLQTGVSYTDGSPQPRWAGHHSVAMYIFSDSFCIDAFCQAVGFIDVPLPCWPPLCIHPLSKAGQCRPMAGKRCFHQELRSLLPDAADRQQQQQLPHQAPRSGEQILMKPFTTIQPAALFSSRSQSSSMLRESAVQELLHVQALSSRPCAQFSEATPTCDIEPLVSTSGVTSSPAFLDRL